ncbi:MAG: NTP transferase domain-containing protein [Gemmatimonadota bacterium]|nr:NTP transferase domain-containing protein [Gemmatimonadota bacterium]
MTWNALIAALDAGDKFRSTVSVYMHPLAGRPILWHILSTLGAMSPPPEEIRIVHHEGAPLSLPGDPSVPIVTEAVAKGGELLALRAAVTSPGQKALLDGAAPLLTTSTISRLLRASDGSIAVLLEGQEDATPLAVAGEGPALASAEDPRRPGGAVRIAATSRDELIRVCDRHSLAEAGVAIRDRLVRRHEENGVSFVLPATSWVDADVTIGPDTVVYPGAVIEGHTEIGAECVIGPHCHIVESTIGRGAELKGWNYVTRTAIRNQAVLEPHVKRGLD